ncbi:MAG: agglutinin biogenesis protein MshP [Ideonella sp.]
MVSVLFILVVLAALGAAMASFSARQQLGSAMDQEHARALQAARAGLEWAAWQVLRASPPPAAAPACFASTQLTLAGSLSDFKVNVSCTRTPASGSLSDGATSLVFYQVVANACNAGSCPVSGTPGASYVERQLSSTLQR